MTTSTNFSRGLPSSRMLHRPEIRQQNRKVKRHLQKAYSEEQEKKTLRLKEMLKIVQGKVTWVDRLKVKAKKLLYKIW